MSRVGGRPHYTFNLGPRKEIVMARKHCKTGVCIMTHEGITCHPEGKACEQYIPAPKEECQVCHELHVLTAMSGLHWKLKACKSCELKIIDSGFGGRI